MTMQVVEISSQFSEGSPQLAVHSWPLAVGSLQSRKTRNLYFIVFRDWQSIMVDVLLTED